MTDSARQASPRVCIVIGKFHPDVGGGESHARNLGRELAAAGATVHVLTRRTRPDLLREESLDGMFVHRVGPAGMPRAGKYVMLVTGLVALYRLRREYDVIYVCALRTLGILGIWAKRLLGKPVVLRSECQGELSGNFIWQGPQADKRCLPAGPIRLYLRWRNRLFRGADRFLSIAGAITQEYRDAGVPAARIVEIPNGIETDRFHPVPAPQRAALRRELSLPAEATLFVYTGKLNHGKGLEMLLRAWKTLCAERAELHLVLVGSGGGNVLSCEDMVRAYVRDEGLSGRVTFTGFVHNVSAYLQAADVFVFPSDSEVLSLAILEALSCELPVLTTRTGGTPEIITDGENGYLIDVGDASALLERMRRLAGDADGHRAMGARGRETVQARYSIRRVAEQHATLFATLAAGDDGGTDAP